MAFDKKLHSRASVVGWLSRRPFLLVVIFLSSTATLLIGFGLKISKQGSRGEEEVLSRTDDEQIYREGEEGHGDGEVCKGRYIYIYNLAPKFNQDLLDDCEHLNPFYTLCARLSNEGCGVLMPTETGGHLPGGSFDGLPPINGLYVEAKNRTQITIDAGGACWHDTDQYTLEVLVHKYMRQYACVTTDPNSADAFYLPFYPGLDSEKFLFTGSRETVDQLGSELAALLRASPMWQRHGGRDHFYVLGRPTWDFRNYNHDAQWGVPLLAHPELNTLRLTFEGAQGDAREFGIPYPTAFHPTTDRQLAAWLAAVRARRPVHFTSFIGGRRKTEGATGAYVAMVHLRNALMQQCSGAPGDCHLVVCNSSFDSICGRSSAVLGTLLLSDFCLQPPGDSSTRKSVFDSLLAGCIPVFFDPLTAYSQYTWHLPPEPDSYSVFIPGQAVTNGSVNVLSVLRSYSAGQIARMHETILTIIPGIVYAKGPLKEHEDAGDIAIRFLLNHISRVKQGLEPW
eukprot:jgi/Mesen1/8677/ME000051S08083